MIRTPYIHPHPRTHTPEHTPQNTHPRTHTPEHTPQKELLRRSSNRVPEPLRGSREMEPHSGSTLSHRRPPLRAVSLLTHSLLRTRPARHHIGTKHIGLATFIYQYIYTKMDGALIVIFILVIVLLVFLVYLFNRNTITPHSQTGTIWKSVPSKYEGLTTMSPSLYNDSSADAVAPSYNTMDKFGLIDSSMTCSGSSYSNLNGNICLNKEQTKLLTTRGGNAVTGTDYE